MIEVLGIEKKFGNVQAVSSMTFTAEDRQITSILGPNGAGKSTAMRVISGLVRPDRGSVKIQGIDVQAEPQRARRQLGILPDAHGLYPRLTARENIRYFAELAGLRGDALEQGIEHLLDLLSLRAMADRKTQGFSQGERMKVALARAMVHQPSHLMLDEPTNGLDVMSTRAMRDLLRGLRNDGTSILLSSHIMQEVAALSDTIVIVAAGTVVAKGSTDELCERAKTTDLEEAFIRLTDV